MIKKIAVFAQHSLFSDGIASQLSARPDLFETYFVDVNAADAFDRLLEISPSIILVDKTDLFAREKNILTKLLEMLPQSAIVQLDYESAYVKILSSVQRKAHQASDLIAIICDLTPVSRKIINV